MPTLNPLLDWLLTGTALLGAWYGGYRLALRSERGFGYNRAYLVAGPLLAVALPLLPLAWPTAGAWAWAWGQGGLRAVPVSFTVPVLFGRGKPKK